jgi:rRNA maturation endonuclease Nob1
MPATLAVVLSDGIDAERMIDEGGPVAWFPPGTVAPCATCGGPKSERAVRCARCAGRGRGRGPRLQPLVVETTVDLGMAQYRPVRNDYRLYCYSCGRSAPVASPPRRPGRCTSCGGTLMTELDPG